MSQGVKHGFYTDFYSHDRIFSKPCGYFFSQGKKHSSSDPRTRDRYGDPCTPSNKITHYVKGSFIELFSC